jgi:poly-gamma-glutamate biosynthesis protein PgsC/CapC
MILEHLLIGLLVGFLFYELVGLSPGGVVSPGYLALYITQPGKIVVTIVVACIVWMILEILSRYLILFGKRKLLLALLIGFCLKIALDHWMGHRVMFGWELQSIGYIIPGLIANEMHRQKVVPTLASLAIVLVLVALILRVW